MQTCRACGVSFEAREYGAHIQTNYHRMNAERATAGVPPLSYSDYCQLLMPKAVVQEPSFVQRHVYKRTQNCWICGERISDAVVLLRHLNDVHFYYVRYFQFLIDPQGLADQISAFAVVYHRCLECGAGFENTSQILSHMRTTSHSYAIDENTNAFFDFTESWPQEMRGYPGCRTQPFHLFDKESIARFRRAGIIGDYRKPRPHIPQNALLARGMTLTGKVQRTDRRDERALKRVTDGQRPRVSYCCVVLLFLLTILCIIYVQQ